MSRPKPPMQQGRSNDFQTPPEALWPLLPYLDRSWYIWECAAGEGQLCTALRQYGYTVLDTDINTGQDFLTWYPWSRWLVPSWPVDR